MKRILICFTIVVLLLGVSNCSNIAVLRVQELKLVQNQVDSLRIDIKSLNKTLREGVLKGQKEQNELLRLIRADYQVRFDEVTRGMENITGSLSESQTRLTKIDEKTREIKNRWEQKAIADSLVVASESAEVSNLFDIALNDFTVGRYDIALGGFQDVITRFSESSKAEESQYWIGECYYVQSKYSKAMASYKTYIKKYPQNTKICAALFKLGLVYGKRGKRKSANVVFEKLIKQCPQSEEAEAAKSRLKK